MTLPTTILSVEVLKLMTVWAQHLQVLTNIILSISVLVVNLKDKWLSVPATMVTFPCVHPKHSTSAIRVLSAEWVTNPASIVRVVPALGKLMSIRVIEEADNCFMLVLPTPHGVALPSIPFGTTCYGAESNVAAQACPLLYPRSSHEELFMTHRTDYKATLAILLSCGVVALWGAVEKGAARVFCFLRTHLKTLAAACALKAYHPHVEYSIVEH